MYKSSFRIPDNWEYRGEGNCHVVLGIPSLKKVLRIRKKQRPNSIFEWILHLLHNYFSWWFWDDSAENRDLSFYLRIMRPLVGYQYVADAKFVKLDRKGFSRVEANLDKLRPGFRKNKVLDIHRATLLHDYTTSMNSFDSDKNDVFTIEIKPKKGWIPENETTFPQCIFCMNQYLKLETKRIEEPSSYCPKKLFSGIEEEMKQSIFALMANPQNNFRIFKNGQIVYDENIDHDAIEVTLKQLFQCELMEKKILLDGFIDLIYNCLTLNLNCKTESFEPICRCEEFMNGKLPRGCVLERILSIQMLDVVGVQCYNNLLKRNEAMEWEYVDKLLNTLDPKKCVKCFLRNITDVSLSYVPYLIAAVANDCSIMISLKKINSQGISLNEETKNVINTQFGRFFLNIGVIDLYPKPLSTLKKHKLRNEKLLKMYKSSKD